MNIAQRTVAWLSIKFKEEDKNYSRWTRYQVKKRNGDIFLSKDGVNIAYIELQGRGLALSPTYWKEFPLNNRQAGADVQKQDLIDTLWYITSAYSRSIFYREHEKDEAAIKQLAIRNFEVPLNQVTGYLNYNYSGNVDSILRYGGDIYSTIGYPHVRSTQIFNPTHYTASKVSMRSFLIPPAYAMENLGYRWYEPSNSWWPASDFNDEDIPNGYLPFMPQECSECGRETPRTALHNGVCQECVGVPADKILIHSYSTRAPSIIGFKGEKKKIKSNPALEKFTQYYKNIVSNLQYSGDDTMYLGIEMEYEVNGNRESSLVPILRHLHEHAIIKGDGSLRNGVEIVTCPATYEEQVKVLKPFFDSFPSMLKPEATCGIHIHISRGILAAGTQGRLLAFMNNQENKSKLTALAGRYNQQYAGMGENTKITQILRGGDSQRYRMLNTTNTNTLEFRLFKSTDKWEDMLVFMQFVSAIVEYCKPCSTNLNYEEHKKYGNFEAWLKSYRKEYPNLHALYYPVKKKPILTKENTVSVEEYIPF